MHKRELPGWCQILDELTSETAKESSNDQEELGWERIRKKGQGDKGGANAGLQATTSAHTTAVSAIPRKDVLND